MISPGSALGSSAESVKRVFPRAWVRVTKIPMTQPRIPQIIAAVMDKNAELVRPSITRGLDKAALKFASEMVSRVNGTPGAGSNAR